MENPIIKAFWDVVGDSESTEAEIATAWLNGEEDWGIPDLSEFTAQQKDEARQHLNRVIEVWR